MNNLYETPPEAVRNRVVETVIVGGRRFAIERPADMDELFDHAAVRAAFGAAGRVPYWSELWPAGRMLAKAILRDPWDPLPTPPDCLEIGCGLGLGGVAAAARGFRVTFSDCDATAVSFAAANARRNGFANVRERPLDIEAPPPGLRFPVIVGSDLMYRPGSAEPLAGFLAAALAPGGVALVTDPDRAAARGFAAAARDVGLTVTASFIRAGEPGGDRTKGTLYRLTRGVSG